MRKRCQIVGSDIVIRMNLEKYIEIQGTRQYIQVRGNQNSKVVVLVLHGGPGGAIPYISYYYQKPLEEEFLVVQWDQRGCGRTYYENIKRDSSQVTVEQLLKDLDELVDYIKAEYNVLKVVILGHSWGSILGSIYIRRHPEKVICYIGVSQVKQMKQGEIFAAGKAIERARQKNDNDYVKKLSGLIHVAETAKNLDDMKVKDYLGIRAMNDKYLKNPYAVGGLKMMKLGITSPDMTMRDMKWFWVSGFRLNKFISIERELMQYCIFDFDLESNGYDYNVPLYYIFGKEDWITSHCMIEDYYKKVNAPAKKMYLVNKAGHSVFIDAPKHFCKVVKEILKDYN